MKTSVAVIAVGLLVAGVSSADSTRPAGEQERAKAPRKPAPKPAPSDKNSRAAPDDKSKAAPDSKAAPADKPTPAEQYKMAPTKSAARLGKDPLVLELGVGIGPFKLGMPMADVVALDASLRPVPGQRYSSQRLMEVGYDAKDRLSWISFHVNEYAPGVVIEGNKLVKPFTSEQLQKAVPGCGKVDVREGSSLATCKGGTQVGHAGMIVAIVLRAP